MLILLVIILKNVAVWICDLVSLWKHYRIKHSKSEVSDFEIDILYETDPQPNQLLMSHVIMTTLECHPGFGKIL